LWTCFLQLWWHWLLPFPDLVNGVTMSHFKQLLTRLIFFYPAIIQPSFAPSHNLLQYCKVLTIITEIQNNR
jgi:hypothetical protein